MNFKACILISVVSFGDQGTGVFAHTVSQHNYLAEFDNMWLLRYPKDLQIS